MPTTGRKIIQTASIAAIAPDRADAGCAVLPTALLAWNLPDDDPEDLVGLNDVPTTVTANREDG